jgi:predicted peptidase
MNKLRHAFTIAFSLLSLLTVARAEDSSLKPGQQVKASFSFQNAKTKQDQQLRYWIYLPKNYVANAQEKFPLVLFLHGSGERGANLDLVKKHGPPSILGVHPELDSCIIVSPQCPSQQWWNTGDLKLLCDDLLKSHPIDSSRVYLTGLSMGGFATWTLLAEYPQFWAAAVPICGGGDPQKAASFKHVPLWVFHGAKDPAVPLKASQEMVDALKSVGADPKFTIYPEEAHQSWIPAYKDPSLWKWLLSQKRATASK